MSVRLSLLLLRDRISQALHRPRYLHADRAIAKFRKDVRHAIAGGERRLDLDVSALQELDPEADDYVDHSRRDEEQTQQRNHAYRSSERPSKPWR